MPVSVRSMLHQRSNNVGFTLLKCWYYIQVDVGDGITSGPLLLLISKS